MKILNETCFVPIIITIVCLCMGWFYIEESKNYQKCLESETDCTVEYFRNNNEITLPNGQKIITKFDDIFTIYLSDNPTKNETIIFPDHKLEEHYGYKVKGHYTYRGIKLYTENNKYQTKCYLYNREEPHNLCGTYLSMIEL